MSNPNMALPSIVLTVAALSLLSGVADVVLPTLSQIYLEAHTGPYIEDGRLTRAPLHFQVKLRGYMLCLHVYSQKSLAF